MSIFDISKVARNEFITDVVDSIQKVTGETRIDVEDITSCLIVTANAETCDKWETWLELDFEPAWTLQDRIDRIVYTINSKGFFTQEFLKTQANIFTNDEIEVEEQFENWHFIIKFTSVIGLPPNLDNFSRMVNINKPAHLTWVYKLRYRTHKELQPFTHKQLQKYTHKQLREQGIIAI